jgi:hypothetical protein
MLNANSTGIVLDCEGVDRYCATERGNMSVVDVAEEDYNISEHLLNSSETTFPS